MIPQEEFQKIEGFVTKYLDKELVALTQLTLSAILVGKIAGLAGEPATIVTIAALLHGFKAYSMVPEVIKKQFDDLVAREAAKQNIPNFLDPKVVAEFKGLSKEDYIKDPVSSPSADTTT